MSTPSLTFFHAAYYVLFSCLLACHRLQGHYPRTACYYFPSSCTLAFGSCAVHAFWTLVDTMLVLPESSRKTHDACKINGLPSGILSQCGDGQQPALLDDKEACTTQTAGHAPLLAGEERRTGSLCACKRCLDVSGCERRFARRRRVEQGA